MTTQPNSCLQMETGGDGVLTFWIDSPERSVNVFDADMIVALEGAVEHLSQNKKCRLAVFRSRKPGCFFAGADVTAIATLSNPDDVRTVIQRGQHLMQRVADLPISTVAVIDGMCMGGGLEFALACSHRVASDSTKTKLGLPEIRLGLLPGWGGTQRLPKLVGLQLALKMILKGSTLNSAKALRAGLVDRVIASHDLDAELARLVDQLSKGLLKSATVRMRWRDWVLERNPLGRALILNLTRKKVAAQSGHYPALPEAIEAVRLAFVPRRDGFAFEREAFTRLMFTRTSQSLVGLFVQRDRAKKISTWLTPGADSALSGSPKTELPEASAASFVAPKTNRRISVIGAGAMGAGIGVLAAQKGLQVVFKEIDEAASRAGADRVERLLDEKVAAHRMSSGERQQAIDRCAFTTRWEDMAECDLAIEAVLEIDSIKRDVFQHLDRSLPSDAALVSNTSSLSVTQLAAATKRRHKVAGLHFFNPVDRMELIEVVRTEMTDEATLLQLLELVKRLGKTPLVTSDKPGFLVNRVLFPYLGEAVRMVAEGGDIATLDRELKRFGMPMGPLELIDQVGIDIASHVASSLAKVQADAEIPAAFLADMADRKWLGKKTKLGFYHWGRKRKPNTALQSSTHPQKANVDFEEDGLSAIQRRLVYPMLNEAVHCLDELVVTDAWMVDLGLVLGTGFAPMHGGPLRLIDFIGAATVLRNMNSLERVYGRRFAPADGLAARVARQEPFFSSVGSLDPQLKESNHESRCSTES